MEKFRTLQCKWQSTDATPDQHINAYANCHLDHYAHGHRNIAANHHPHADRDSDTHRNADPQAVRNPRSNRNVLVARKQRALVDIRRWST